MSFYVTSPYKRSPRLLVMGTPEYLFGSWNADVAPTQGFVISNSSVGTTATVTIKIQSGQVPVPDSLLTIVGSSNSAGIFNVTNAPILTVSAPATPDAGLYVLTFLISSTTQGTLADSGLFYIAVPEVGTQMTSAGGASEPACSPVSPPNSVGKSLSATVKLPANTTANPSTLSGVTVVLQGANLDFDTEYTTVGTITSTGAAGNTYEWQSGQAVGAAAPGNVSSGSVNLLNFRFYRFNVTGATGAGPIIAKLME